MEQITQDTGNLDLKQAEETIGIAQENAQKQNAAPQSPSSPSSSSAPSGAQTGAVAPEKPVVSNSGDGLSVAIAGVTAISPEIGSAMMLVQEGYSAFSRVFKAKKTENTAKFGAFTVKSNTRKQERQQGANLSDNDSKSTFSRFTNGPALQKRCANDDFSARFQTARSSVGDVPKGMNITGQNAGMYSLSLKSSLEQVRKRREEGPQIIEDAELQKEEVYSAAKNATRGLKDRLRENASEAKILQTPAPPSA